MSKQFNESMKPSAEERIRQAVWATLTWGGREKITSLKVSDYINGNSLFNFEMDGGVKQTREQLIERDHMTAEDLDGIDNKVDLFLHELEEVTEV